MPDEINEAAETPESPSGEDGDAERGKKGFLRLILITLPMILLPAAGGAYLAYSQFPMLAEAAVEAGLDFGVVDQAKKDKRVEYGQFGTLKDLLINPAGAEGKRFLVLSLGLETKSSDVLVEIEERDIVIRDAILRLLSSYTSEELAAIDLRARIKDEILAEMNAILQKGQIERLYFTQYLLQ